MGRFIIELMAAIHWKRSASPFHGTGLNYICAVVDSRGNEHDFIDIHFHIPGVAVS